MDLKSFYEDKLKLDRAEFAARLGVEEAQVAMWEKDPGSIPLSAIAKITSMTGLPLESVTGWTKPTPKPLVLNDDWDIADFTKRSLADYIAQAVENAELPSEQKVKYVDGLKTGLTKRLVKPKVAIVGRSDTGKSTLINALLGSDKMPTAWTPTTSIAVYIKHISDRPAFIESDVWMFSNHLDGENAWDEQRLYDEEYCRAWKISEGGVELLRTYGTRQGEEYGSAAGAAVVFLDAPILRSCDIIDLPGFGTETESDDNITFGTARTADVIIYLSQANGFMRIEDITYLKQNISELPIWEKQGENDLVPLANLFVVASQAHTVNAGNHAQLTAILDVGCENLMKTLPEGYWETRKAISGYGYENNGREELRSRFFTYTTDILDLCAPFNAALKQVLDTLPKIINERAKAFVRKYVEACKPDLTSELKKYEGIAAEREKYVKLLAEVEDNEVKRTRENEARKAEIRSEIKRLSKGSADEFSQYLAEKVNVDAICQQIKEKGIKNKQTDVELFASTFQSEIQMECEAILSRNSKTLSEKTAQYITSFSESVAKPFESNEVTADFNAGWAFMSALSKLGTLGGLGALAASTISVAVGLGVTGISILGVGTTAMVGVLMASPLAPIGIAAGLLLTSGMGLVKLFGGGWEKSVAKKMVSTFEEKHIGERFREAIKAYWDQTGKAFEAAAAGLDEEWESYVNDMRNTVNGYDVEEIGHKIQGLKNISDFFENIPL